MGEWNAPKYRLLPTILLVLAAMAHTAPARDAASELDREYERIAHEALARYFDDGTFLVRASVELLDEDESPSDRDMRLSLPGLPAMFGQSPSLPTQAMVSSVQLDILVDTTYTSRDRDFIEYLVTLAADLDTSRGDEVLVRRAFFPRDNRAVGPHRRSDAWNDPMVKTPSTIDTSTPRSPVSLPSSSAEKVTDRILDLLPLLVVCLTALLCAWLLGRAILSSRNDSEERLLARLSGWRRRRKEEASKPAIVLPGPRPAPPAAPDGASPQANIPDASTRHSVMDAFVGDPRLSGQVLKTWLHRDPRKGAQRVAALLAGSDSSLLDMVRDVLGVESVRAVESFLGSEDRTFAESAAEAMQLFLREHRKASSRQTESTDGDLFGFLDQLSEVQIAYVLKGESAGVAGFALTQISPAKTSSILSKVDPTSRARLLVGMGNVSQIPKDVYREMADKLSLKALEAASIQYVATDGVDALLKIIEALPLDDQFGYIHSISEIDINLAHRIRERTITFAELGSLPDRFLGAMLQALDPEILALSLLRADQDLRNRMLSVLPERQRLMLQSTMDARGQAAREEIDEAAQRMLKTVRDEIRRKGRPQ